MTDRADDAPEREGVDERQQRRGPGDDAPTQPFRDADVEAAGSAADTTDDSAARSNYAVQGALGGVQSGMSGYATGAVTAAGDSSDAQPASAEVPEDLDRPDTGGGPTAADDTRGLDEPVGPTEVADPDDPDA